MRIIQLLLFLCCLQAQAVQRKVLFLGNSYTGVNNLPQLIANAASSTSDTLVFEHYTPGGYTLNQHLGDSTSLSKIMTGDWDYVVLQEQSQLPSLDAYDFNPVIALTRLVNQYHPCARVLFYMTWGRKNGDASNCTAWPPVCTYEGMDSLLRLRYLEMADINHAEVSPVGAVWHYLRWNQPAIELYQTDESHPSEAGSYAAACSFYSLLFRKDPAYIPYNFTLDSTTASQIRQAARAVAFDSLAAWDFREQPTADFGYTIGYGLNEVNFINRSQNAEHYHWDFGDGVSDTAKNPSHSYLANGTYVITLTAVACDLDSTYVDSTQKDVTFCSHSPTIFPDTLIDCPNSVDTLFTQTYDSYQWFDEFGNALPGDTLDYIIPSFGSYSVMTTVNGCSEFSPPASVFLFNAGLVIYYLLPEDTLPGPDTLCTGDTLFLVLATNKPPDTLNSITWYRDGVALTNSSDTLFVVASGGYVVQVRSHLCSGATIYENLPYEVYFHNCISGLRDIESSFYLSPNPIVDICKLVSERFGRSYIIRDMTGREVGRGAFDESQQIDLSFLADGMYIITLDGVMARPIIKSSR